MLSHFLNMFSSSFFFMLVFKFPIQVLSCPRGLQEPGFLDLLRSTFSQLTEHFEVFTADETRTLAPLKLQTLTPEEIRKSIRSTRRSTLYVRAKVDHPLPADDVYHMTGRRRSVTSTVGFFHRELKSCRQPARSNFIPHRETTKTQTDSIQGEFKTDEMFSTCSSSGDTAHNVKVKPCNCLSPPSVLTATKTIICPATQHGNNK